MRTKTPNINPSQAFPLPQYISLVAIHSILLAFTALYLPRSSDWLRLYVQDVQKSSLDRPQHPFIAPLTAHPPLTVFWICTGVVVLDLWWAGWIRLWTTQEKNAQVKDSTKRVLAKLSSIRNAVIATGAGTIVLHVIFVSFGAPIASSIKETASLSLLISLLTIYVPVYTLPIPYFALFGHTTPSEPQDSTAALLDKLTWTRLFSELRPDTPVERAIVYPAVGTLFGCWLGAFPLALDWDRPWQSWPLGSAYGGVFGHIAGSSFALLVTVIKELAREGKKLKKA